MLLCITISSNNSAKPGIEPYIKDQRQTMVAGAWVVPAVSYLSDVVQRPAADEQRSPS